VIAATPLAVRAQLAAPSAGDVTRIDLPSFRSLPLTNQVAIQRVTVTNPDVADVVVIGERDVVINGKIRARPISSCSGPAASGGTTASRYTPRRTGRRSTWL
jgi:Flp pilus assembly secretin CpaC